MRTLRRGESRAKANRRTSQQRTLRGVGLAGVQTPSLWFACGMTARPKRAESVELREMLVELGGKSPQRQTAWRSGQFMANPSLGGIR
jgi:hypothetical protein